MIAYILRLHKKSGWFNQKCVKGWRVIVLTAANQLQYTEGMIQDFDTVNLFLINIWFCDLSCYLTFLPMSPQIVLFYFVFCWMNHKVIDDHPTNEHHHFFSKQQNINSKHIKKH